MTDCEALRGDLKAYVDRELAPARRFAVNVHLARCRACQQEVEAMERIGDTLRVSDTGEMSAELRARILQQVGDAAPPEPEPAAPEYPRPLWRKPLVWWGAGATALLCWFVFYPMMNYARYAPSAGMRLGVPQRSYSRYADETAAAPSTGAHEEQAKRMASAGGGPVAGAPGGIEATDMNGAAPAAPGAAPALTGAGRDVERATDGHAKSLAMAEAAARPGGPSAARSVRREASITVTVDGAEKRSDTVEQITRETGGYVEQNSLSTGDDGLRSAALTLRIPVARFDEALRRIAALGIVTAKNVKGEDVTERLSDEERAARALSEQVASAHARARQPSADLSQIAALKVQAAQAQGRLELLRKLAALATVTVELNEKPRTEVKSGGFVDEMGDTGRSAVNSFLLAARLPVLLLIWVAAYCPVWVPLLVAYRYAARAQRRRAAVREARQWQTRRAESAPPA